MLKLVDSLVSINSCQDGGCLLSKANDKAVQKIANIKDKTSCKFRIEYWYETPAGGVHTEKEWCRHGERKGEADFRVFESRGAILTSILWSLLQSIHNHPGNIFYRETIEHYLPHYTRARCKLDKSLIVSSVAATVNEKGSFVREQGGRWFEIDDLAVRERIGAKWVASIIQHFGGLRCHCSTLTMCPIFQSKGFTSYKV